MKVRIPIRIKILFVFTTLLLVGLSIYVALAIETFKKDKLELIYDLNHSGSSSVASQIENNLESISNDFKLFVQTASALGNAKAILTFKSIIEDDPLLVSVGIYTSSAQGLISPVSQVSQNAFIRKNKLPQTFFDRDLLITHPIPFSQIDKDTVAVWNATMPHGPVLLGVGIKIIPVGAGATDNKLVIAGYIKGDGFLKTLKGVELAKAFLVDSHGRTLLHPERQFMESAANLSQHPLVGQALSGRGGKEGVMKFREGSKEYIGAYSTINFGHLSVVTQTESALAFLAIKQLVKRSVAFALAVMAFTFFVTMIFSDSLTDPLTGLMEVMKKVSAGDLSVKLKATTKDEIGVLTEVFNKMTGDLKTSRQALIILNQSLEEKVKERTKQLEDMAIKDALTGMYNRRYFNDKMNEEINRTGRTKRPLSIVYLDIDHFKKYNDGNGHPQGDVLLKQFAKLIQDTVRKTDLPARLGGEEFCIILPETDLIGAAQAAEKIRLAVESTDFPFGEKQPMGRVTCSLGISEYPKYANNEEDLIKSADEALYHVKEGGRNAVGAPKSSGYTPVKTPKAS